MFNQIQSRRQNKRYNVPIVTRLEQVPLEV